MKHLQRRVGKTLFRGMRLHKFAELLLFLALMLWASDMRAEQPSLWPQSLPLSYYGLLTPQVAVGGQEEQFQRIFANDEECGFAVRGMAPPTLISLKIANTGNGLVRNPRIIVNNQKNWYSATDIADEAIAGASTPREKAFAIWNFVRRNRYHWYPPERHVETADLVKLFNVYGYGFCDSGAYGVEGLYKKAGFWGGRTWLLAGHFIGEVYYENAWHMLDADLQVFYPARDNETVASVEECEQDGWLVRRVSGPSIERLYTTTEDNWWLGDRWSEAHTMAITLRPGESLTRYRTNWGKYHDNLYHQEPPVYSNGLLTYSPDLRSNTYRLGVQVERNVESYMDSGTTPNLHIANPAETALLICKIESPYVLVGGNIRVTWFRADEHAFCRCFFRKSEGAWNELATADLPGESTVEVDFSELLENGIDPSVYSYQIKWEWGGAGKLDAGISDFVLTSEFQHSTNAMPTLLAGKNVLRVVTDETSAYQLGVELTYRIDRRCPPESSPGPIFPLDGERVLDTAPELRWQPAYDPDDDISQYYVIVSLDSQCRWPVSPLLETETSGGTPAFRVPDGWLNDGRTYYWRVRAMDSAGHWGAYSAIWSFAVDLPPTGARLWPLFQ